MRRQEQQRFLWGHLSDGTAENTDFSESCEQAEKGAKV